MTRPARPVATRPPIRRLYNITAGPDRRRCCRAPRWAEQLAELALSKGMSTFIAPVSSLG